MKERFSLAQAQQNIDQNIITLFNDDKKFVVSFFLSLCKEEKEQIIQAIVDGLNIELHKLEKAGKLRGEPSLCQAMLLDGVFEAVIYDHRIRDCWMTDTFKTIWVCCVLCPQHHEYFVFKSSSGYAFDQHSKKVKKSKSGSTISKKKNKERLIQMCDDYITNKQKYGKLAAFILAAEAETQYKESSIKSALRKARQLKNKK